MISKRPRWRLQIACLVQNDINNDHVNDLKDQCSVFADFSALGQKYVDTCIHMLLCISGAVFPDVRSMKKWFSSWCSVEEFHWSARSPDLNPIHHWLWAKPYHPASVSIAAFTHARQTRPLLDFTLPAPWHKVCVTSEWGVGVLMMFPPACTTCRSLPSPKPNRTFPEQERVSNRSTNPCSRFNICWKDGNQMSSTIAFRCDVGVSTYVWPSQTEQMLNKRRPVCVWSHHFE